MRVDAQAVYAKYLPRAVSTLVDAGPTHANLAVAVFDEESQRTLYATDAGRRRYELRLALTPMFPRWFLAAGYRNTTIDALARANFRRGSWLILAVSAPLLLGIVVTVRAAAREVQLAEAKSTFVSHVSHELKTPLALIRLYAENLDNGWITGPEKIKSYARVIHDESVQLTRLIDGVLNFSAADAVPQSRQRVAVDVSDLVRSVLARYQLQLSKLAFTVTTEFASQLPRTVLDRDAIVQAIMNILDNAIKYSTSRRHISVRIAVRDDHIVISFADQGIGIAAAELGRIFEPFYRVRSDDLPERRGVGLGLALVKRVVSAHDGSVSVSSVPDVGSTFTLMLPVTPPSDETCRTVASPKGERVAEGSAD
jgi:signal transduction histidine kinase